MGSLIACQPLDIVFRSIMFAYCLFSLLGPDYTCVCIVVVVVVKPIINILFIYSLCLPYLFIKTFSYSSDGDDVYKCLTGWLVG